MVILLSEHQKILKNQMKRMRLFYGSFMALVMVLPLVLSPMLSDAPVPDRRSIILEALKTKPLTIGQALSISEIIIEQSSIVPIPLLLAVIQVESEFKPFSVSNKGARGLMQIRRIIFDEYVKGMGLTFKEQGFDPCLNVRIGIQYLGDLFLQYNDWNKALVHFYSGSGNNRTTDTLRYVKSVQNKIKQYGG